MSPGCALMRAKASLVASWIVGLADGDSTVDGMWTRPEMTRFGKRRPAGVAIVVGSAADRSAREARGREILAQGPSTDTARATPEQDTAEKEGKNSGGDPGAKQPGGNIGIATEIPGVDRPLP